MPPARKAATGGSASPPAATTKRKADNEHDPSISPPPTRRKTENAEKESRTSAAARNFFTPTSQKKRLGGGEGGEGSAHGVVWKEVAPLEGAPASLLVATYKLAEESERAESTEKVKIASFDLDSTLITTASGKKHADSAADWKWWHPSVPKRLRQLHADGFRLVIFSNQGGLDLAGDKDAKTAKAAKGAKGKESKEARKKASPADRVAEFRQRCTAILERLDLPVRLYAATGKDLFRKPRPGMWELALQDMSAGVDATGAVDFDIQSSFFVGDAAGRLPYQSNSSSASASKSKAKSSTVPKDFSCSDRNFAANIGLSFFTPEEHFLDETPRPFERGFDLTQFPREAGGDQDGFSSLVPASSSPEILLFCGPPGAGKSSFFHRHLAGNGYRRVNQDTLKTKEKCLAAATGFLKGSHSVVVDNTNPDLATRKLWIDLASKHGVPIRCLWFRTTMAICEHNDTVRALNKDMNPEGREALPRIAFNGFNSRFKEPSTAEGFADVMELPFQFRGTPEQYAIWGRYWL